MFPRISLLKCLLLINVSTIHCFNAIIMKNLNEKQLVNKLTELVHRSGKDTEGLMNIEQRFRRNPSHDKVQTDDDSKEEIANREENNDDGEDGDRRKADFKDYNRESDSKKGDDVDENESDDNLNNYDFNNYDLTLTKERKDEPEKKIMMPQEAIETNEEMESIKKYIKEPKKPISRIKHNKKKRDEKKSKKNKKKDKEEIKSVTYGKKEDIEENIAINKEDIAINKEDIAINIAPFKSFWNSLRSWFRRDAGGLRKGDDDTKIALTRIINLMRSSENKKKGKQSSYSLRALERSGEEHDPLAPGKLPHHMDAFYTTTPKPRIAYKKPHSFWNYWTYAKEIFEDNCNGEGLIQVGNMCLDKYG